MAKANASVGMELVQSDKFFKQLQQFTLEVQNVAVERAVEAGTKPILTAMIANTPESSGSREQQSTKTRQKWANSRKLKTTITAVVRKRMKFGIVGGAVGIVGPAWSGGGGQGNLFSRDHKRTVLWGRDGGGVRSVNQFVKKTADETRSAANAKLNATLAAEIDKAAKKTMK